MNYGLLISAVLLGSLLAMPAGAFSADSLTIRVDEAGGAVITFDYSLSWLEHIAVFLQVAKPENELKHALESFSGKPVNVISVQSGSAVFSVDEFAQVREINGTTRYTTPALDFFAAEKMLKSYWFAPLIHADFSPTTTVVAFPDGFEEIVHNQHAIPAFSHEIN